MRIDSNDYAISGNVLNLGDVLVFGTNTSIVCDVKPAGGWQYFGIYGELTLSGHLLETTGSGLRKLGGGTLILTGDNSAFNGAMFMEGYSGVVQIQHPWALGAAGMTFTVSDHSQLQVKNVVGTVDKDLVLNGSGNKGDGALLNVSGTNELSGSVLIDRDTSIGAKAGAMTLSGLISDSDPGESFTILGSGEIRLTHAIGNTYRGTTIIDGGILTIANTSGSATGTGPVVINHGGTLRGDGIASGETSLNSGGLLDPLAFNDGSLQTGPLTWNGAGLVDTQLGAGASDSDRLVVAGALTKGSGGLFQFDFDVAGAVEGNVYDLIDFTSTTFTPADFSYLSNNPQLTGFFSFDSLIAPTKLLFNVTAVPEPTNFSLLSLVLVSRLMRRSK